jgi:alpha-glucosidase
MASHDTAPTQWWQTGVIYQVYPRSFQDTPSPSGKADGIGDLPGITARLDYLVSFGVDALWISPFYPSPMADFGYDVANYTGVDPLFGTLADFDALLAAAHGKGLRIILDFVPNHTSDQHPWFLESRSSRDNPKRNWYLWHDPIPYPWLSPGEDTRPPSAQEPNNWMSQFGGPAWTWDETTQQFYLHSFLAQQPDLNWRNPEVRATIYAALRFWLDRGVDGFRMDVLWLLIKDEHFRNNVSAAPPYNADQPETQQIVAEMRAILDSYPDSMHSADATLSTEAHSRQPILSTEAERSAEPPVSSAVHAASNRVLIGEIYLPLPELVRYYGTPQLTGANLPFNFHLIQTQWNAAAISQIITHYESLLPTGAWPNYVLGNHDQSRLATRIGPLQARAAAMLLLTLRGTPTLYYGDELGMTDVPIAPSQVQDPAEKNQPNQGHGRDPERSPMLWLDAPNAGFTTPEATPWLPLLEDWPTRNAATQSRQPRSMLTLYRSLLALRRQHDTLHAGAIADVSAADGVLRFRRVALLAGESTDFQILLNLGNDVALVPCAPGTIVLTTLLDGEGSRVDGPIQIEAGEGLLIALDAS